ncbi:DUF551 domain-containing protein [Spirosoma aerolatum]|uniref:DUF551 domain-containing protein n=1 Tax=Spirosoma aerolatum TaxID=1211326 RepID=UPI0009AD0891
MKEYWIDIKKQPLPTSGTVIVSVTRREPIAPVAFTSVVRCDEIGPMDSYGDVYMYAKEITHWMELPKPMLPTDFN